jgi:hypothetical protein
MNTDQEMEEQIRKGWGERPREPLSLDILDLCPGIFSIRVYPCSSVVKICVTILPSPSPLLPPVKVSVLDLSFVHLWLKIRVNWCNSCKNFVFSVPFVSFC